MATCRWVGLAIPTAQVETFTVGSATSTETFGVTINGKDISYTAGSGETTSTVAAALQALLSAATAPPEFQEVTWTVSSAVITATAATPGVPFTTTKTGTGTFAKATVTASSGPNHADAAANWSTGAVPANTNDTLIDGGPDILYGLGSVTSTALNSFRVKASFTGSIGLPPWNPAGYYEYRTRAYPLATAVPVTIGEGDGSGPVLCNLSVATALSAVVLKTGQPKDATYPVVNISTCGSGTLVVADGSVGVGADDDTATPTVTTGTIGAGTLVVGRGATVTTLNHDGGAVTNLGTVTTLNIIGGTFAHYSGNTITTITADPSPDSQVLVDWRCGGTITTATFRGQGTSNAPKLECGNDPRAKTLTNHTFTGGAVLNDPDKLITMSNAGTWDRASLAASNLGPRMTLTRS